MTAGSNRTGGIVLCGGSSRRMGTSKAMLPIGGTTVLDHVVRTVQSVCDPVVVAARPGQALPLLPKDVEVVWDTIKDFGPLAGIAAGFAALASRCETTLVVACDYVLVQPGFMLMLIESIGDRQAVIVEHDGHIHPLLACYHLSSGSPLQRLIDSGQRRVKAFVEACDPLIVRAEHFADIDQEMISVTNVNDPADWNESMRGSIGEE